MAYSEHKYTLSELTTPFGLLAGWGFSCLDKYILMPVGALNKLVSAGEIINEQTNQPEEVST
jgi:hypothetical protein